MTRSAVTALVVLVLAACGDDSSPGLKPGKAPAPVNDARIMRARLEMRQIGTELMQYQTMHGDWPESLRVLRRSGTDPWGHEYAWEVEDGRVAVWSAGPDGEFETEDDVFGEE